MSRDSEKTDGTEPRDREFVQSLARGLTVLSTFGADRPRQSISDVARVTGLTRAAARRFLYTLEQIGYLRQTGDRFQLTPKVLDVAYAYVSSLNLAEVAQPHMEALVAATNESSSIGALDGTQVVYTVRVPTSRIMTVALTVGSRVLLAAQRPTALDEYFAQATLTPLTSRTVTDEGRLRDILDTVRTQGWALVDQELEEGIRSVATPLRNDQREVIGALNVSTHAGRVTKEHLKKDILPQLLQTADRINADLGLPSSGSGAPQP
jgi:IclR family transcriptional regulator, pca regulon regulatory protein